MFVEEKNERFVADGIQQQKKSALSQEEREMLIYFKEMKCFLTQLELPWDTYIPILHKSLFLYAERIPGREARNKAIEQSFVLMKSLSHLSKKSCKINRMVNYCDSQITLLGCVASNASK